MSSVKIFSLLYFVLYCRYFLFVLIGARLCQRDSWHWQAVRWTRAAPRRARWCACCSCTAASYLCTRYSTGDAAIYARMLEPPSYNLENKIWSYWFNHGPSPYISRWKTDATNFTRLCVARFHLHATVDTLWTDRTPATDKQVCTLWATLSSFFFTNLMK